MKLNEKYNQDSFIDFIDTFLPEDFKSKEEDIIIKKDRYKEITKAKILGFCESLDLHVLEMDHTHDKDRRIAITTDAFKILADHWIHKALVIFKNNDSENYRLSFLTITLVLDPNNKVTKKYSNARRYSFYLGPNASINTPNKFLINQGKVLDIEDLVSRFSVEIVTEEFFENYKDTFFNICDEFNKNTVFNSEVITRYDIKTSDFVKKLMGQIVFLYFLQRKGWIGVKIGEKWGDGDPRFMRNIFNICIQNNKNYYNDYLEPLFYDYLGKANRGNNTVTNDQSFASLFNSRIPYLNGGLFESIYDWKNTKIEISNDVFDKLLSFLDLYNFTVDENTPSDQEVSVDPEMLGKIFENLLEIKDRKSTGSYYTPREIVHYMCRESLINYLFSESEIPEERLRKLFNSKDTDFSITLTEDIISKNPKLIELKEIADKVDSRLRKIKIIDPAVGSGAFPMGMLSEISSTRYYLNNNFLHKVNVQGTPLSMYDIKRETLENCIYGVDLDPGAIDIAKLRFWLALVVDHNIEEIEALPNLDYKIMQGNSLLEDLIIGESIIPLKFDTLSSVNLSNKDVQKVIRDASQSKLFIDESDNVLEDIRILQAKYFKESNSSDKKELKNLIEIKEHSLINSKCNEEIDRLKTIIKNSIDNNKKNEAENQIIQISKTLENLSKERTKPYFLWHLNFAEVFEKNGGFDIVIANPPYVGEKGNKDIFRPIAKGNLKEFYQGKMDLFYFFFHLALNLGKKNSSISFITTNYYLNAMGAKKLREDFKKRAIIERLINFNELKIFKSALGQHNMITILKKDHNDELIAQTCISRRKGLATPEILNKIVGWEDEETDYFEVKQKDLFSGENIKLTNGGLDDILDEVAKNIRLKEIANVNAGVQTSADKFTDEHRKNYPHILAKKGEGIFIFPLGELKKMVKNEGLIKPWFKNSDATKWITNNTNKSELFLSNFIANREQEPDAIDYLARFKEILINRSQPEHMLDWWDLHQIRMKDKNKTGEIKKMIFDGPKIVNKSLQRHNDFAYNDIPWYAPSGAMGGIFYITAKQDQDVSLKYLLSVLNSKLIYVWLYNRGKRKGEMLALSGTPLSEIPIKKISELEQKPFIDLVNKILDITKTDDYIQNTEKQEEVKDLEHQIDMLVYKLYNLTSEEVEIVENSSKKE